MPDVFTAQKRSLVMSRIRATGNRATEMALAALFRKHGVKGWRRHTDVFGRPDFVFPKYRVAVFVDGCFWHRCPIHATAPRNNQQFWRKKLAKNVARDRLVTTTLRRRGWSVIRVWEHELEKRPVASLHRVERQLARHIRQLAAPGLTDRANARARGSRQPGRRGQGSAGI